MANDQAAFRRQQRRTIAAEKRAVQHARGRPRRKGKRKPNPYAGPLYDPTATLSGKDLATAADRLVALEYGPKRAALDREAANATTQGTALIDRGGGYYKSLGDQQAQDVARQKAIGDQLKAALDATRTRTGQEITQAGQEADQRASQDESVRGAGLEGGSGQQLAAEIAAQRIRSSENAATNDTSAAQGTAAYQQLSDLTSRATAARGGEVTGELSNRLANTQTDIRGRRTSLESEAAGKRVDQLVNLRQTALENLLAMRGLDIKTEDLRASVAHDKATLAATTRTNQRRDATTRRGQNLTRQSAAERSATTQRGQNISAEQRAADRAKKDAGKPESASAQKLRSGVENALEDIRRDPKFQRPSSRNPDGWDRILRKRGAPAIVRRAAVERAQGGITPETARTLRGLGVQVPGDWLRRKPRRRQLGSSKTG